MKIISKNKDYYDWVADIYGGGDPLVVYDRRQHNLGPEDSIPGLELSTSSTYFYLPCKGADIGICSLCSEPYYVIRENCESPWRLLLSANDPTFKKRIAEECSPGQNLDRILLRYQKELDKEDHSPSPKLLKLSREINRPVFIIKRHADSSLKVLDKIPNLGELGFASVIQPQQMYQKLAYFIGNLLHESPDLAPPVQVSDKDKIRQYGFDLKTSFRGKR